MTIKVKTFRYGAMS